MKLDKTKNGFTIIEVSLVLAIAGLIFAMVFIALPSLRSQQRDTDRREDLISFLNTVKDYQKNNRGTLPGASENDKLKTGSVTVNYENDVLSSEPGATTWAGFYKNYLGDDFIDPNGEHYNLTVSRCGAAVTSSDCINGNLGDVDFPNGYNISVVIQATCSGERAVATSNPRKLAVIYKLEGAGIYCNNI